MKYLLTIVGLISISSCKQDLYDRKTYMDITVIRDVTDPHLLSPDANSILGLFDLSENKDQGVNFRYREISDKILAPSVDLQLPDELVTAKQNRRNEPFYRDKVILNFYDTIRKTLGARNTNDSSFLGHSECFTTICDELKRLAKSKSSNRVLIVFSNLFENSTLLSVYKKKVNQLDAMNPEVIAKQFDKTHLLPENLNGIKVFFVFEPATRAEDAEYLKMAGVYKQLLESKGATVNIEANNNYLTRTI